MKKLALSFAVVLIFLVVLISAFLSTQAGLRSIITIAKATLPGELSLSQAQGTLLGNIQIKNLSYESESINLSIASLDFDWKPSEIFSWNIDITKLHAKNIIFKANKPYMPTDEDPSNKDSFSLPIGIKLNNVNIQTLDLIDPNDNTKKIQSIELKKATLNKKASITDLKVVVKPNTLNLSGYADLESPYDMSLKGSFDNKSVIEPTLSGHFSANGSLKKRLDVIINAGKDNFVAEAHLNDFIKNKSFNINAHWKTFTWAYSDFNYISSPSGTLHINGNLNQYQAKLNTSIKGNQFPTMLINLDGEGNLTRFIARRLSLTVDQGTLSGHARVNWSPSLAWEAELNLINFNPAFHWPSFKGRINGQIESSGELENSNLTGSLKLTQLSGQLHNLPLSGSGQVLFKSKIIAVHRFNLALGQNKISFDGNLGQNSQLSWTLNVNDLSQFYPGFTGQIQSSGNITGDYLHPVINTNTQIKQLSAMGLAIKSGRIQGMLDTQFKLQSHFYVNIDHLQYNERHIHTAYLSLKGNRDNHKIYAHVYAKKQNLYLDTSGNTKNDTLNELITQFTITSKQYGNWQLTNNINLKISPTSISFSPFCWQSDINHSLCLKGNWSKENAWSISAKIKQLNLGLFNFLLPHTTSINGVANSQTTISGDGNAAPNMTSLTNIASLIISAEAAGKNQTLKLTDSQVQINADKDGLTSNTTFHLFNNSNSLALNITLPNYHLFNTLKPSQKITGLISFNMRDLNRFTAIAPEITKITGYLFGQFKLDGTLESPNMKGELKFINGSILIHQLGLQLTGIGLNLRADREMLDLEASVHSGKGQMKVQLKAPLKTLPDQFNASIDGTNFTVANNSEYKINISPKLNITYNKPKLVVSGQVLIPYADITPNDFSSAVTLPSTFQVITPGSEKAGEIFALYLNQLNVTLGKQVRFKYMGLNADLVGAITINSKPHALTTAIGKISAINGAFTAYGKKLTLKNGNITFTGESIDDPALDILAVKVVPVYNFTAQANSAGSRITVGVNVTGSASDPQITLYSIPTMSQTDILSYLLFDKPANTVGGSNAALLGQTAALLAAGHTQGITSNIQESLGLSTIGLESSQVYVPGSTGPQSTTSFVIGKRLTDRLEAIYSVGISVPVSILLLQYQISHHWQLQTQTSSYDNGADIMYTIESG